MKFDASPQAAVASLKNISPLRPTLAIVLGSGFHHALAELRVDKKIFYAKIPGFPKPTVSGHAGELYFGHFGKTPALVLSGRAHFYEATKWQTCHVRRPGALAAFGVTDLLLTNAAGGINQNFRAGDFRRSHRPHQFHGRKSIARRGNARPAAICGLDGTLTQTIARNFCSGAGKISKLKLQRGVYLAVSGPSYETPRKSARSQNLARTPWA